MILDLIGNTPLICLNDLIPEKQNVSLWAKAEWMNPGGSLKDRPVKNMLVEGIKSGQFDEHKILLDSSSGNAGIAYAMIGNALGLRVQIVIPGNASQERKDRIIVHGAELIETDPLEGYDEALRHAHHLYEENPDKYWLCDQYKNDNNWLAHYLGTAEEILSQVDSPVTHFIGGVGTGGSLTGIGRRLKQKWPDVNIIAVRPEVWPGIEGLKPLGSPEDIVPEILDQNIIDEWVDVTADEAKSQCFKLAKKGVFAGQSSGAYIAGCLKVIQELDEGNVVTLLNDIGDRYFSAGLWEKRELFVEK